MTKGKIVRELAKRIYGDASPSNVLLCKTFCDCLQDIMIEAWLRDDKVMWEKFFVALPVERAAHRGRNPKTNEVEEFPPMKSIKFTIHPKVKGMLNEEGEYFD